jgi:hypothetical protein
MPCPYLIGDGQVVVIVTSRRGQRAALYGKPWVECGHARAGIVVQFGPQQVSSEVSNDPPFVMMRAIRLKAVRGSFRPDHRNLSVRCQVACDRCAKHSPTDDQEIHDQIVPKIRDGSHKRSLRPEPSRPPICRRSVSARAVIMSQVSRRVTKRTPPSRMSRDSHRAVSHRESDLFTVTLRAVLCHPSGRFRRGLLSGGSAAFTAVTS